MKKFKCPDDVLKYIGRQIHNPNNNNNYNYREIKAEMFGTMCDIKIYRNSCIYYKEPGDTEYKILKYWEKDRESNGRYYKIRLFKKAIYVHRLVACCFNPTFAAHPEDFDVNHMVTYRDYDYRYCDRYFANIDYLYNHFDYLECVSKKANINQRNYVNKYMLYKILVSCKDINKYNTSMLIPNDFVYNQYKFECDRLVWLISQDDLSKRRIGTVDKITYDTFVLFKYYNILDSIMNSNLNDMDKIEVRNLYLYLETMIDAVMNHNCDVIVNYYKDLGRYDVDFR